METGGGTPDGREGPRASPAADRADAEAGGGAERGSWWLRVAVGVGRRELTVLEGEMRRCVLPVGEVMKVTEILRWVLEVYGLRRSTDADLGPAGGSAIDAVVAVRAVLAAVLVAEHHPADAVGDDSAAVAAVAAAAAELPTVVPAVPDVPTGAASVLSLAESPPACRGLQHHQHLCHPPQLLLAAAAV